VSEQQRTPRVLWSLALGNFAIGVNALVVAGVLLPMAEGLRVTPGQIGLLVSVYALTYALISPVLVAVSGGVQRKLLILIGLGLLALGSLIGALAPDFSVVMFSRIIAAFGAALFTPTASSVAVALIAPEHRGRAIGLVFAGFTVATAFGVPLGALIGVNVGWRATFLLVTGLASLGALAVMLTVPAHVKVPPPNAKALLEVLRSPVLATGLLVTVLQLVAQYSVFTFIAPILKSSLGLDGNGLTAMLLAFGVASVIGNLITASSTDRFGADAVSLACLGLLAIVFGVFALEHRQLWLVIALMVVWGAVGLGFQTPQQSRLVMLEPKLQSATLALNASAIYLGTSGGSFLGGRISSVWGYDLLPWVAASMALLAIATFLVSRSLEARARHHKHRRAEA
jgi:MFS transporter, DHA1 family, inner membrane transport protein